MNKPSAIIKNPCKHKHTETHALAGRNVTFCSDCGLVLHRSGLSEAVADINAPTYYTRGKIETWDFILDKGMNFLEGNIIKYVTRWRQKNGVDDLKKARVYLDKLIEEDEKK